MWWLIILLPVFITLFANFSSGGVSDIDTRPARFRPKSKLPTAAMLNQPNQENRNADHRRR